MILLAGSSAPAFGSAQPPPRDGDDQALAGRNLPEPPAGAVRVVNHARHGSRLAVCAEEPGPPLEHGERLIPRTRVWVHDGQTLRQVATPPGTCDPAWSTDGARVAVVTLNGLWVLSADLTRTVHLIDTRHSDAPGDEAAHRTLSAPRWAPDSSRLAFLVTTESASWVEAVDARTGEIVHSEPDTNEFAWGVDAETLHFGSRVVRLP